MVDMANHEQAVRCTEIARAAMEANNLDKARRFADKAMKLHASDEVSSSAPWRHMSSSEALHSATEVACIVSACWQAQGLVPLLGVAAWSGTGSCLAAEYGRESVLNCISCISINLEMNECKKWLLILATPVLARLVQLRLLAASIMLRGRQAVQVSNLLRSDVVQARALHLIRLLHSLTSAHELVWITQFEAKFLALVKTAGTPVDHSDQCEGLQPRRHSQAHSQWPCVGSRHAPETCSSTGCEPPQSAGAGDRCVHAGAEGAGEFTNVAI